MIVLISALITLALILAVVVWVILAVAVEEADVRRSERITPARVASAATFVPPTR